MCQKDTERKNENFPFCSTRCRTLDLSRWADGSYSIAGESTLIPDDESNEY
ncbi:MAG: DNA gyrase inhibitor YacG [Mariprofundaceae bacterium]|nr:DNA gyrase inhibitor YacG [Mariprofundaceae bacterium]